MKPEDPTPCGQSSSAWMPSSRDRRPGVGECWVVERLDVAAYKVPTDRPEADGTIAWDSTTLVLVEVCGGGERGLGLSYASRAAAVLVEEKLADLVRGRPVDDVRGIWHEMVNAVRNVGRGGVAAMAISAVDMALWDLKARVHDMPLFR